MGHPKPTGPPKGASTLPRPEGAQTLQHLGGARLTREEQGRESPLGEDGKLARSASERGGAHRLRRRDPSHLSDLKISKFSSRILKTFSP